MRAIAGSRPTNASKLAKWGTTNKWVPLRDALYIATSQNT